MRKLLTTTGCLGFLSACGTGIDAGGESLSENGGVAFILLTLMLLIVAGILYYVLGRED